MTAAVPDASSTGLDPGGGILATATLLTFLRPSAWVVALAGFLARGGVILVVAPIVVVPSLSGLVTAFGPLVNRLVLGGFDPEIVVTALIVIVAIAVAIVLLLLIGGTVDGWMIGHAAADLGVEVPSGARPTAARLAAARLIAHAPLVVAFIMLLGPVVTVTYDELLVPGDLGTPVFLRIAASIPVPIAIVVIAAVLCDALGALAVRAIALGGASVAGSIPRGLSTIVRRPIDVAIALVASLVVLVVLVAPALIAAGVAFDGLGRLLADDAGAPTIVAAVVLLVGSWLGGLLLAGIAGAWRSYAWTCVHVAATMPSEPSRGW